MEKQPTKFNSANPTSGAVDETTDTKKLAGLSSLKAEEHPLNQAYYDLDEATNEIYTIPYNHES